MVQVPGGTPEPPRPRKITARFRGSPRPPPDLPKTTTDPAAPMTVESARRDGPGRAHGHGSSQHPGTAPRLPHTEACKQPGEPGTPQSPVPGSPGPPPALPRPEGAQARHDRLAYRADPGHHGNHYRPADTSAPRRPDLHGNSPHKTLPGPVSHPGQDHRPTSRTRPDVLPAVPPRTRRRGTLKTQRCP